MYVCVCVHAHGIRTELVLHAENCMHGTCCVLMFYRAAERVLFFFLFFTFSVCSEFLSEPHAQADVGQRNRNLYMLG